VDDIRQPVGEIVRMLEDYRARHLTGSENLPGVCIFVNQAIELYDQRPDLALEMNEGFVRLKRMMKRLLGRRKALRYHCRGYRYRPGCRVPYIDPGLCHLCVCPIKIGVRIQAVVASFMASNEENRPPGITILSFPGRRITRNVP